MNASDVLIECLLDWGVNTIFGLPGDGINGIMESLRTHQDKIRFIHVRHEEAAAFMACAYAKYTGKLGVCLATSGPGGIHLLNGLYDAKMDGAPVLAITGMQFHDLIGTHTQQDVELDKLFMDVCVLQRARHGRDPRGEHGGSGLPHGALLRGVAHHHHSGRFPGAGGAAARSARSATSRTTPRTCAHAQLAIPERGGLAARGGHSQPREEGRDSRRTRRTGRRRTNSKQIAETLGAPIVKALLGKAVVPDDSPYTTGSIGLLGTAPSQDAMEECDTLLMVGSSFPYIEFLPKPGQAKGVQIDIDPMRIGLRYPVEVGLVGDSKTVLAGTQASAEAKGRPQFPRRRRKPG